MLKNLIIAALVVLAGLGLSLFLNGSYKSEKGDFFALAEGSGVPNFSVEDIGGRTISLQDYTGRPVIIHFWATWCPPCVVELPRLVAMTAQNENVVVFAVSTDRTREAMDRFFDKAALDIPDNFIVIHDADKSFTEGKFGVFKLPESFILDEHHILKTHMRGAYEDWPSMTF